jgi:hypothetical protein
VIEGLNDKNVVLLEGIRNVLKGDSDKLLLFAKPLQKNILI